MTEPTSNPNIAEPNTAQTPYGADATQVAPVTPVEAPAQPAYAVPQQPAQPAYDAAGAYGAPAYDASQPQQAYGAPGQPQYGQPAAAVYGGGAAPAGAYGAPAQPQYAAPAAAGYGAPAGAYGAPAAPGYGYGAAGYGQAAVGSKSKMVAGLLGIFLGGLGVHNFYLGYTGKAVAQLLLTLVGWIVIIGPLAASIWGLVEGIMILVSKPGTSAHKDGSGFELQD